LSGILAKIAASRPLQGGNIPPDIGHRLATAHVNGRYHFTDEPFLIEGTARVRALGLGGVKLWFENVQRAYGFNSTWNLPADHSFLQLAQHPYFAAAFAQPLSVFALELYGAALPGQRKLKGHMIDPTSDFSRDEQQIYELTRYLLQTFREREVTFLLQNWRATGCSAAAPTPTGCSGSIPNLTAASTLSPVGSPPANTESSGRAPRPESGDAASFMPSR